MDGVGWEISFVSSAVGDKMTWWLPLAFGASREPQSGRDGSNLQTVGFPHPKRQFGDGHHLRHDSPNTQPPQNPAYPSSLNVFHEFISSDFFLLSKASKAESNQ
jgi:hypothetical protein